MKNKTSKILLHRDYKKYIRTLTEESERKQKDQSFVYELLSITFIAPDTSKDQDQFKGIIFSKATRGILFMYPNLN